MKDTILHVKNTVGLHARPATFFIQAANAFKSAMWLQKGERRVNAKSLLGVLSLCVSEGDTIKVIADGADENLAIETMIYLFKSGFENEEEIMQCIAALPKK